MKTPEQMADEYLEQDEVACAAINHAAEDLVKAGFLAGYKAAKHQLADADKVMPQWISVKEQMPAANICVLIAQDKTIWVSGYCDTLKTWGWYENGETCRPTHWMPLPEPPKEEK